MSKKIFSILVIIVLILSITACATKNDTYEDGLFKAETEDFDDRGWKPFIEINIKNGKIDTVWFDYVNQEGKFKSQDEDYNNLMKEQVGIGPEDYTKGYADQLKDTGNPDDVTVIAGATYSYDYFIELSKKALNQSKMGDKSTKIIPLHD